ncbi:hypothetical protein [Nocardia sp. NPDC019395]|uniref:hypothetical protein n=1 Tax=Nocardia sp. NPDC019395 TaxID=3154686 RepID=UPI0034052548
MPTDVRLAGDSLELPGGVLVSFIRTLRLPENGTYPLPPGLGQFPLRRVADYPDTVPEEWRRRGGVMLPVYQREAMWLKFSALEPAALKVGVGKVCAVSGESWTTTLVRKPQNYVPLPQQPWLDGINSGKGTVRQFVAMPLGLGATVEGQVTGTEQWGGVQLAVHGLTEAARTAWQAQRITPEWLGAGAETVAVAGYGGLSGAPPAPGALPASGAPPAPGAAPRSPGGRAMGLGAGGTMRQEVYADSRPIGDYRPEPDGRVFVHLASAAEWQQITGEPAPPTPVTAKTYAMHGLPWFDYYDTDADDLPPADELSAVRPTGHWIPDDGPDTAIDTPLPIVPLDGKPVQDGQW